MAPWVSVVALAAGAAGLVRRRLALLDVPPSVAFTTAAALVLLSAAAQVPGRFHDQGLYYLQAVLWEQQSGATVGVAQLHGRLGFNSSWFPLAALVELPPFRGAASAVLGVVPLALAGSAVAGAVYLARRVAASVESLFLAGILVPAVLTAPALGSMNPDAAVALLSYFAIAAWLLSCARPDEIRSWAPVATLLAVLAMTVKLSVAPLAAGSIVALLAARSRIGSREVGRTLGISAIVVAPLILHGLATSGCLAYPVAATCLPDLPGAVSRDEARLEQAWIQAWARSPGVAPEAVGPVYVWLLPWIRLRLVDPGVLFLTIAFLLGTVLCLRFARGRASFIRWPLALAVLSCAFWWVTAPDPRFALGSLSAVALLPAAAGISGLLATHSRWGRSLLAAGASALLVAGAASNPWILELLRPGRFRILSLPEFPVSPTVDRRTVSGTIVRVPVGTD